MEKLLNHTKTNKQKSKPDIFIFIQFSTALFYIPYSTSIPLSKIIQQYKQSHNFIQTKL